MNFAESVEYLYGLGNEILAMKLGLRSTELLLDWLGNPHKFFAAVQIAGTNGKGSTAAILNSICREAGISTGLYTSPHLVSITERIQIDGYEITPASFAKYATEVRVAAEGLVADGRLEAPPTFFEHVTAAALLAFREAKVNLAILETGLGGRLDATTVARAETVAITPVALDHESYLGTTLEEIASEKAAIIRPGVTAVIAPQPSQAREVILQKCAESLIQPILVVPPESIDDVTDDGRFILDFNAAGPSQGSYHGVSVGLRGKHQITNAAVAIRIAESLRPRGFEISEQSIVAGVCNARYAGRLEYHPGQPAILLDGAHNPAAVHTLRAYLEQFVKVPLTLIFGAMVDKKLQEIAETLFPIAQRLILTKPANARAADVETLQSIAVNIVDKQRVVVTNSVAEALQEARLCTPANGVICATGSLYLVGDLKSLLNAEVLSAAGATM